MALADDLEQAALAAAAHGPVAAVLAAEPLGFGRGYLVALEAEERRWLVLDAAFRPVDGRERVRAVASMVVLCELAAELAGGGALDELRSRLAEVRDDEDQAGLEEVQQAIVALEQTIGPPPVLASPAYLDEVGAATRALETALGEHASPFASALATSSGTVEAFVAEVESHHVVPLR
jgi:hypothetical protein